MLLVANYSVCEGRAALFVAREVAWTSSDVGSCVLRRTTALLGGLAFVSCAAWRQDFWVRLFWLTR